MSCPACRLGTVSVKESANSATSSSVWPASTRVPQKLQCDQHSIETPPRPSHRIAIWQRASCSLQSARPSAIRSAGFPEHMGGPFCRSRDMMQFCVQCAQLGARRKECRPGSRLPALQISHLAGHRQGRQGRQPRVHKARRDSWVAVQGT